MTTKPCPFCAEPILPNAKKCKHCSEFLDESARPAHHQSVPPRLWNPGVAAILSLFIPGAGHIYKGQIGWGLAWLVLVPFGYMLLIVPGLVLHVTAISSAYSGDPTKPAHTQGW